MKGTPVPDSRFDFDLRGIGAELEGRKLAVPIYQRDYAWGEEDRDQVMDYWTDLHGSFVQGPDHEYFLGTIVLSKESRDHDDREMIIDGQQRLATTAILLAAIRDVYRERGDEERASHVQNTYLSKYDLESGAMIPQLLLNADDDPFFRSRIVEGEETVEPTRQSHELMAHGYDVLRVQVAAEADAYGPEWAARLSQWVKFVAERVRIISVAVPTESDAFLIFETLNDRGADLTIADLLKNYLFGRAGHQLNSVRNSWVATMTALELSASGGKLFTDFLRHYWSSRYGATRERELYGKIKERVVTQAQAVDFALDLEKASRLYAAILNSDHEFWSGLGSVTQEQVQALQTLSLEQNRPLLLALMQHFEEVELRKAMRAMVSWGLRGLVVGGIGGGQTEKVYSQAAVSVREGDVKTADELLDAVSAIVPSDEEFTSQFATTRISRGRIARYILIALERNSAGEPEPELVPNEREEEVNLEHVLPKNPTEEDWPEFSPEAHKAMVHRLGNMTLLQKGPNGRIGNEPFATKKPVLEGSALRWTMDAGGYDEWTPAVITERQQRMAEHATETWPRHP